MLVGVTGVCVVRGSQRARAIEQGQAQPFEGGPRHLHPGESPPQIGQGVTVGAPDAWNDATDLPTAGVEPGLVVLAGGIDFDRQQARITELGDALLAVVFEQTGGPVDVGADDQSPVASKAQQLFDAQRRAGCLHSSLIDRDAGQAEEFVHMLARATLVEQHQQVAAIVGRHFHAR